MFSKRRVRVVVDVGVKDGISVFSSISQTSRLLGKWNFIHTSAIMHPARSHWLLLTLTRFPHLSEPCFVWAFSSVSWTPTAVTCITTLKHKWLKHFDPCRVHQHSFVELWLIIIIVSLQNHVSSPFWRKWPSWVDASLNLNSSSILLWRLIMKYFLWSFSLFCCFKKGCCKLVPGKRMCTSTGYPHRGLSLPRGGGAKVSCILRHWGVQLILAYSWARTAVLVAGKGRGGMFLYLLFLHFHSCSSFSVPLFHLFYYLFYLISSFLWEMTQMIHKGWRVVKPQHNQSKPAEKKWAYVN